MNHLTKQMQVFSIPFSELLVLEKEAEAQMLNSPKESKTRDWYSDILNNIRLEIKERFSIFYGLRTSEVVLD